VRCGVSGLSSIVVVTDSERSSRQKQQNILITRPSGCLRIRLSKVRRRGIIVQALLRDIGEESSGMIQDLMENENGVLELEKGYEQ